MMLPRSIQIRFGTFHDVLGPGISNGDFTFVPAEVDFPGYKNGPRLADAAASADAATRALIHPGEDAPWACGRIQRLFQQPLVRDDDRGEKCCMCYPFLAVVKGDDSVIGIPFVCTDFYGESLVMFSNNPKLDGDTMQSIASAFWSLLLQDADELVDYQDRMEHLGAGVTIEFGVEDGEPFMRELND